MEVCLVTAPTVAEFTDAEEISSESVRRTAIDSQLGILSLASVLESRGESPRIVDLNHAYLDHSLSRGSAGSKSSPKSLRSLLLRTNVKSTDSVNL